MRTDADGNSTPMNVWRDTLFLRGGETYVVRSRFPEPTRRGTRRWTDKTPEQRSAVYANRRRMKGDRGKRLQRLRSEFVERTRRD